VVEMIYQMGMAGFLGFKKTIAALKAGNYQLAAAEMLNSRWARQDSPNRAKDLAWGIRYLDPLRFKSREVKL